MSDQMTKPDGMETAGMKSVKFILKDLCQDIGYGRTMQIIEQLWREIDPIGALTVGPCAGLIKANPPQIDTSKNPENLNTSPGYVNEGEDRPREFWIETHESVRGKIDTEGNQRWPQVYESKLDNTILVREVTDEKPGDVVELDKDEWVKVIYDWKHAWMNQTQNDKADFENYRQRAFGVDANMIHSLAVRILAAIRNGY